MKDSTVQSIFDETYIYYPWGLHNDFDQAITAVNNKIIKKFIIFGPQEHTVIEFDYSHADNTIFNEYLKSKNVELIRVVGAVPSKKWNPAYLMSYDKTAYGWSTYFAYAVVSEALESGRSPIGHSTIKKSFISLNRRPHHHRCMFIDIIHKYGLQDHGIITWHNYGGQSPGYNFEHWTPVNLKIDEPNDIVNNLQLFSPPPQFQETLFSVVSESTGDVIFLTEKTFMPIFHKRPLMIFGPKNIHGYLKKLKFKLFDEIIDYSFDSVDDQYTRYDMAMVELKKICKYDPNELLKLLKPKIDHNYVNLVNIVKYSIGVDDEVIKITKQNQNLESMKYYKNLLNYGKTPTFQKFYKDITQEL